MLRNSADGVCLQTPANALDKLRNDYEIHSMNSRVQRCAGHTNNKLRGLSPRAKYTDRAAAAGRRS